MPDLSAQPPLLPKALLPPGFSPLQHDVLRPTLGDTTLMSSLRKRNLPTSSWKRLPQLFMQDSSTWGEGPGEPQHGVSSRFRSQLPPAPPWPGMEPMAILTAAEWDTPLPSQVAKHPPKGKQEDFPLWGQSFQRWLNSPWKGNPLESSQTPGFHIMDPQHH